MLNYNEQGDNVWGAKPRSICENVKFPEAGHKRNFTDYFNKYIFVKLKIR